LGFKILELRRAPDVPALGGAAAAPDGLLRPGGSDVWAAARDGPAANRMQITINFRFIRPPHFRERCSGHLMEQLVSQKERAGGERPWETKTK